MVAVVDGQGGGLGKSLVERLRREFPQLHIRALGTNALATSAMLKAGADEGATGENAIVYNAPRAAIILGPVPILMPNGILGEITPKMAEAIGSSDALKILIPVNRCQVRIAIPQESSIQQYIDRAVGLVQEHLFSSESP